MCTPFHSFPFIITKFSHPQPEDTYRLQVVVMIMCLWFSFFLGNFVCICMLPFSCIIIKLTHPYSSPRYEPQMVALRSDSAPQQQWWLRFRMCRTSRQCSSMPPSVPPSERHHPLYVYCLLTVLTFLCVCFLSSLLPTSLFNCLSLFMLFLIPSLNFTDYHRSYNHHCLYQKVRNISY